MRASTERPGSRMQEVPLTIVSLSPGQASKCSPVSFVTLHRSLPLPGLLRILQRSGMQRLLLSCTDGWAWPLCWCIPSQHCPTMRPQQTTPAAPPRCAL